MIEVDAAKSNHGVLGMPATWAATSAGHTASDINATSNPLRK